MVHGGAWDIPDEAVKQHKKGVQDALTAGWTMLSRGGTSVDVVTETLRMLENDDTFDAGRGSFVNMVGDVELEASIMDGSTLMAGAVAAVQNIKNPILLARAIMEKSEHVLLAGIGATRFAREHGVKTCGHDDLITDRELARWREYQSRKKVSTKEIFRKKKMPSDTVGAIALDKFGNVASGTSTGGTPNKHPGRVGDSPIIGCGTFADNEAGAVATTGWGEALMKVVMAKTVYDLMEKYGDPSKAIQEALSILEKKTGGYGGVVALTSKGKIGFGYNTPRMARGYMTSEMRNPVVDL